MKTRWNGNDCVCQRLHSAFLRANDTSSLDASTYSSSSMAMFARPWLLNLRSTFNRRVRNWLHEKSIRGIAGCPTWYPALGEYAPTPFIVHIGCIKDQTCGTGRLRPRKRRRVTKKERQWTVEESSPNKFKASVQYARCRPSVEQQ